MYLLLSNICWFTMILYFAYLWFLRLIDLEFRDARIALEPLLEAEADRLCVLVCSFSVSRHANLPYIQPPILILAGFSSNASRTARRSSERWAACAAGRWAPGTGARCFTISGAASLRQRTPSIMRTCRFVRASTTLPSTATTEAGSRSRLRSSIISTLTSIALTRSSLLDLLYAVRMFDQ